MNRSDVWGFTLIELLVVVTIIVVLLALLAPSLDKAVDSAMRAVCATNQDQLHGAVAFYSLDNKNRLMQTVIIGTPYRLAALARKRDGVNQSGYADEFSVLKLGQYTGGVEPTNPTYADRLGDVWFCPNQIAPEQEPMQGFLRHHWEGSSTPLLGFDHLFLTYSYFARVGTAGGTVTRPQDLTGDRLGSSRLLFSDTIYWGGYTHVDWMFNHGVNGPSFWNYNPIDSLQGANQAFGDGSVHWKPGERFNIDVMRNHLYDPTQTETGMMDSSSGLLIYW